jgi:hypothetical protein
MIKKTAAVILTFTLCVLIAGCAVRHQLPENASTRTQTITETVTVPSTRITEPPTETQTTTVRETHTEIPTEAVTEIQTEPVSEEPTGLVERITEIISAIIPTTAAPETTVPVTKSVSVNGYSKKQVINYFVETAMNSERGVNLGRVLKWTKPVRVYIGGNSNDRDEELIRSLCATLNTIDGFPGISVTGNSSNADIIILFAGRLQLASLISDFGLFDDGYCGLVWNPSYSLSKAVIGINSSIVSRSKRNSVICEEFLQAMGIPNDSDWYKNSVFYQTSDSVTWPSKLDWGVVSVLYNPGIKPGMTKSQAREVAETFVK